MIEIVDIEPKLYNQVYNIQAIAMPENDVMDKALFMSEFGAVSRKYFVALENETAIGYIGLFSMDTDYNIISFAVLPEYQRSGVGSALLERAIKFAKDSSKKTMSLEVDVNNEQAISFYKNHGFFVTNIRKNYYKNSDAMVMFLNL